MHARDARTTVLRCAALQAARGGLPLEARVLGRQWTAAMAHSSSQQTVRPGACVLSVADWKRRAGLPY